MCIYIYIYIYTHITIKQIHEHEHIIINTTDNNNQQRHPLRARLARPHGARHRRLRGQPPQPGAVLRGDHLSNTTNCPMLVFFKGGELRSRFK